MKSNRPTEPESEVAIREHVFDGIEEYDNNLPNWWLFTFYAAIVIFIVGLFIYYQAPFRIPDDGERIDREIAGIEAKKTAELESMLASLSNESLQGMSADASHTAAGKAIFDAKCSACHGLDLSATMGGIQLPGLPLNDSEWKYGGTPLEIMKIVTDGSPDVTKGMVAWKAQLSPSEIAQVVAYILSQQKT